MAENENVQLSLIEESNIEPETAPAAEKKVLSEEEKRQKAINDYIERLKIANDYSDSYNVSLAHFEGPIDLLLHLIKAAKIGIEEIFISQITEQYLSYMDQIKNLDLERASEFIDVAAILIEIKSKSVLPDNENEPDDDSAKRELIQKIEEYKLYKEASGKMKEMEVIGAFFKEPDSSVNDSRIVLKDMTMDGLMQSLQKLFLKIETRAIAPAQRKIILDRFTVTEKAEQIKDVLLFNEQVKFFDLFEADYSKSEIITTFQAILELLKGQYATVEQQEVFGEIIVRRTLRTDEQDEE